MANVDKPSGLTPVRYRGGAPYNGAAERFYIPSSATGAVYRGGLVKLLTAAADADGVMSVTGNVATSNPVLGVVVGIEMETADSLPYRAASTARYCYVATDQDLLYRVQDDAAGTPTAATVGNAADLTGFTSGNASGQSAIEISGATLTTSGDGTEDVIIMGVYQDPNNTPGDHCDWLVRLNNYQPLDGHAGI